MATDYHTQEYLEKTLVIENAEKVFISLIEGARHYETKQFVSVLNTSYAIAELMHEKRKAYRSNNDEGAK